MKRRDLSSISQYRELQEINRGGMGQIFQALDPNANRLVALKLLPPGADGDEFRVHKFLAEAQITAQLEHPNIVPVYEVGLTPEGQLFFAMQLVKGVSLEQRLTQAQCTLPRLLAIFDKVCDAVAFAHSRGVVHRDLKPDNVMIGEFGEVLLMDWGLARLLDQPEKRPDAVQIAASQEMEARGALGPSGRFRTLEGEVLGTPQYMPPEQARGELERVDQRSDIYSLGGILYKILTLTSPHTGATAAAVLDAASAGAIEPPSQRAPERPIPRELEAVVMKAMDPVPDARYQSVPQLQADIKSYL